MMICMGLDEKDLPATAFDLSYRSDKKGGLLSADRIQHRRFISQTGTVFIFLFMG